MRGMDQSSKFGDLQRCDFEDEEGRLERRHSFKATTGAVIVTSAMGGKS
jgi:hypothetical protein